MPKRPQITEVFTPRRAEVNEAMYIARPTYETALKRSVDGTLHTIVSGESGSGKSWLYKKVSEDKDWCVFPGNFANAARGKSISEEICNTIVPNGTREWTELSESIDAKVRALFAEGGGTAERKYTVKTDEALEVAFEMARSRSKNRRALLVLDNLEAIFNTPELMDELGNIILLLDDARYAKYDIKLLLVGVPANIVEYYQQIENLEPIGNRIEEILHVRSLTRSCLINNTCTIYGLYNGCGWT